MSAYDDVSQPYVATIETEGKRYTVSVRITFDGSVGYYRASYQGDLLKRLLTAAPKALSAAATMACARRRTRSSPRSAT